MHKGQFLDCLSMNVSICSNSLSFSEGMNEPWCLHGVCWLTWWTICEAVFSGWYLPFVWKLQYYSENEACFRAFCPKEVFRTEPNRLFPSWSIYRYFFATEYKDYFQISFCTIFTEPHFQIFLAASQRRLGRSCRCGKRAAEGSLRPLACRDGWDREGNWDAHCPSIGAGSGAGARAQKNWEYGEYYGRTKP